MEWMEDLPLVWSALLLAALDQELRSCTVARQIDGYEVD